MLLVCTLAVPLVLALHAFFFRGQKSPGVFACAGYLGVVGASALLLYRILHDGAALRAFGFLYLDTLSAFFMLVISVVASAASLYSIGYIQKDIREGLLSARKARLYYVLFNFFCFSMLVVPVVDNLGMLWVAVEMTTLVSALLVGFYNTKESVEAAWKYIIICSVGIIFALLGTILFSYAFSFAGGAKTLNWSSMAAAAGAMDKNILKIAFIFIVIGYGTKAGLAPMHTWLPDAHSQAVSPISALLSGVLLKTALYAILRFGILVVKGVGFAFFSHLMLLLGGLSLAIACGFILVQKDLKRLLAYSSIEHLGIIAIGFGLGTPMAVAGALLHVFNHAVTKALMFFGAGTIVSTYKKHTMSAVRGVLKVLPFTGVAVLLGVFALTGFPPFSIFISEVMILVAAFDRGSYLVAGMMLVFLAAIFGAFIHHYAGMLFGNLPRDMVREKEPLSGKLASVFLLVCICGVALALPFFKKELLWIAQKSFQG